MDHDYDGVYKKNKTKHHPKKTNPNTTTPNKPKQTTKNGKTQQQHTEKKKKKAPTITQETNKRKKKSPKEASTQLSVLHVGTNNTSDLTELSQCAKSRSQVTAPSSSGTS